MTSMRRLTVVTDVVAGRLATAIRNRQALIYAREVCPPGTLQSGSPQQVAPVTPPQSGARRRLRIVACSAPAAAPASPVKMASKRRRAVLRRPAPKQAARQGVVQKLKLKRSECNPAARPQVLAHTVDLGRAQARAACEEMLVRTAVGQAARRGVLGCSPHVGLTTSILLSAWREVS